MDITIEKNTFLKALAHAQRAVEKRNTIPILSHVRLAADKDKLILTATDMEISLTEEIKANVKKSGTIAAPATILHQIVSKLPEGADVHLKSSDDNGTLNLACGQAKFSLQLLPADEFPEIESDDLPVKFSIAKEMLDNLLGKTHFAMSSGEARHYLNGIYLHTADIDGKGKRLLTVATDGHRLAKAEAEAPQGCECAEGIIIPRKAILEVREFIRQAEGAIEVALSDSKIRFDIGNLRLFSKLVDGTFPDYERVIPNDNSAIMSLACPDFKRVVDRVAVISSERLRGIKLLLKGQILKISAVNPSHGSAEEELAIEYDKDDLEIGFNAQYLLDIAEQVTEGGLEVAFADASSPALIRDSGNEDVLFVLMPMRV